MQKKYLLLYFKHASNNNGEKFIKKIFADIFDQGCMVTFFGFFQISIPNIVLVQYIAYGFE